jgi:hypothetical protein
MVIDSDTTKVVSKVVELGFVLNLPFEPFLEKMTEIYVVLPSKGAIRVVYRLPL